MTTPDERLRAIVQAREFLEDLCNGSRAETVPEAVRREARRVLRHFPRDEVLHVAAMALPQWFTWREVPARFRRHHTSNEP